MNKKQKQFLDFYKQSKKQLFNVAYSVVLNKEAAEDVLQDSYIKAWNKFDTYDQSRKFSSWMTTIVRNTAIDYKRSSSKKSNVFSLDAISSNLSSNKNISFDVEDKELDMSVSLERAELMETLYSMIDNLPSDLATVMYHFVEGKSYDEISKITDLSLPSVRARVHRAKKMLRSSSKAKIFANF